VIGAVIYFGIAVLCVWPFSRMVDGMFGVADPPEPLDRFFSVVMGTMTALLWPIILVALVGWRASRAIWTRVLDLDDKRERVQ
jgi:hypothetical protein